MTRARRPSASTAQLRRGASGSDRADGDGSPSPNAQAPGSSLVAGGEAAD
ncbi:MAG: hypothetical protein HC771_25195 [Synechococcales cyanobacterium CRU_2_2]|nr:hypothetical protein [Synechococcales cyanobacterium CRU_2_2]